MEEILSPESEIDLNIGTNNSYDETSTELHITSENCIAELNEPTPTSEKIAEGTVISSENHHENYQNQSNKEAGQEILSNPSKTFRKSLTLPIEPANDVEFQIRSDQSFNAGEKRQISAQKNWKTALPSQYRDSANQSKPDLFQVTVDLSTPSGTLTGKSYLPSRHGSGHETDHPRLSTCSMRIPILTERSDSTREASLRSTITRPESSDRTICFKCIIQ